MLSLAKKLVLGLALVAGSFVALGSSQAEAGGFHYGCVPYYGHFHYVKPYYYHYHCTPYYIPYYKPFCW